MELTCDLHIHTALSPCADDSMTPNNIVNMARLLELDVIAITDHNSAGNCRAVVKAAEGTGLTVIPGMELCTAEEIHVVCLFPDCDAAERFGDMVRETLPPVKNKSGSFGRQLYMDSGDEITGVEDLLLTTAGNIGIGSFPALAEEYGGICWPAHIDRPSYSILAMLGDISADMGFRTAELSRYADEEALLARYPDLRQMRRIRASDAHDLEIMVMERYTKISPARCSSRAVVEYLREL